MQMLLQVTASGRLTYMIKPDLIAQTPSELGLQSYITRFLTATSELSEWRKRGKGMETNDGPLPITCLRILAAEKCKCGRERLLVQTHNSLFVKNYCVHCRGEGETLKGVDDYKHLWVDCPHCHKKATPAYIAHAYGFKCEQKGCPWFCHLAIILPLLDDL
jgi:hypothetical protein